MEYNYYRDELEKLNLNSKEFFSLTINHGDKKTKTLRLNLETIPIVIEFLNKVKEKLENHDSKIKSDYIEEELFDEIHAKIDEFLEELYPRLYEKFDIDPYGEDSETFMDEVKKHLLEIMNTK